MDKTGGTNATSLLKTHLFPETRPFAFAKNDLLRVEFRWVAVGVGCKRKIIRKNIETNPHIRSPSPGLVQLD